MRTRLFGATALFLLALPAMAFPVFYEATNETGQFWDRPNDLGPDLSILGPVQYHAQPFFTDLSGEYDIVSLQDYDGYIHLYEGGFDPLDPLTGLIEANDDGELGILSSDLFFMPLFADTQYVLVTSAFAAGDTGEFLNVIADLDGEAIISLGMLPDAGPPPTSVPEPGTLLLIAAGLLALPAFRYSRR